MSDFPIPAVVTGATGFIGKRLVAALCRIGVPVIALKLPLEDVPAELPDDVEWIEGDISSPDTSAALCRHGGTIFHLAAVVGDWAPEALFQKVTVTGTGYLMAAARKADMRFVLVSSICAYGDRLAGGICLEDGPVGVAAGPYGRSKQAQESLAREFADRGLKISIVRPGNVYGPGSQPWVTDALAQLRKGTPALIGGGNHYAGLVYVDNLVDLLVAAAGPAAEGECFNGVDPEPITWRQYFSDLSRAAGLSPPKAIPYWLASIVATIMEKTWSLLSRPGRPPLTREALNLIGRELCIPGDKAEQLLGHHSKIAYRQGMLAVANSLAAPGK